MKNTETSLKEEWKLLWRATRTERSRFIIIQYNHYDLVRQVQSELQKRYPKRPFHRFNLQKKLPPQFAQELLQYEEGFLSIEHFEEIFRENHKKAATSFNQRRDAFRPKNSILLIFLPIGSRYLQDFSTHLPDFYSVASPLIQLIQVLESSKNTTSSSNEASESGYANQEEAQADIDRIEKRLERLEAIEENERLRLALSFDRAKAFAFLGQYQAAQKSIEQILAEAGETLTPEEKNAVQGMLGQVYRNLGRYSEAAELLEAALASARKNFGEAHPTVATRQSNLANVYLNLGRYSEAAELLEAALASDRKNFGEAHPTVATSQSNLANVYFQTKKYKETKRLFENAYAIFLKHFGENHPHTQQLKGSLEMASMALQLEKKGIDFYDYVKQMQEKNQ